MPTENRSSQSSRAVKLVQNFSAMMNDDAQMIDDAGIYFIDANPLRETGLAGCTVRRLYQVRCRAIDDRLPVLVVYCGWLLVRAFSSLIQTIDLLMSHV